MVALYGARAGQPLRAAAGRRRACAVRGVWRDYARQFGAVAIDDAAYRRLTGDTRVNDLALWLARRRRRAGACRPRCARCAGSRRCSSSPACSRSAACRCAIFDRSFAVTYYLQALAIGIGLFGIAASFSAQVLARRRGVRPARAPGPHARAGGGRGGGEGAAWTAAGALLGLALGLAVSVVLVHVVNPQSFHWTMELLLPWGRLAALFAAVLAGRQRHGRAVRARGGRPDAVLAVKEDW